MNRQKWILTGLLAFFFGFPVAGISLFWGDMHRKIRQEGDISARKLAQAVFDDWDPLDYTSRLVWRVPIKGAQPDPDVKPVPDPVKLPDWFESGAAKWGGLVELGPLQTQKSYARPKDDQIWQHFEGQYLAKFAKGEAIIEIHVTRLMLEQWELYDVDVRPVSSGS